ncbi:hypothetical protein BDP67DRAFT_497978 [Colletotrichum lupini]|nr:hypothetical protein BDP67DRAFT_497978 [Colletotrichum lupini]
MQEAHPNNIFIPRPSSSSLHLWQWLIFNRTVTMDTAGSECLENQNSTDCLLRALLNILAEQKQAQDAGIDWDPITFGFTLLIGLVASMIALATVFQAVLAGGKGGRRANGRAIGKWSKRTTRKWILSEMSWSYTAYTPMLRLDNLKRQLDDAIRKLKNEEEKKPREEEKQRLPPLLPASALVRLLPSDVVGSPIEARRVEARKAPIPDVPSYPATWLALFKTTGLENFDGFDLMPVTADYLPEDFVAAPASAEVGAIVVIAAAAGVQRLDADADLYPVIIGCGFQFDFRQHPVLGVIGAFSEHHSRDNDITPTPSLEKLREASLHANGLIELQDRKSADGIIETHRTDHRLFLLHPEYRPVIKGTDCFLPDRYTLSRHYIPTVVFLWAKSPKFTPSLFPGPVWKEYNPFTAIALNGGFWSKVRFDRFQESDWDENGRSLSFFKQPFDDLSAAELRGHAFKAIRGEVAGRDYPWLRCPQVLRLCLTLLNNPMDLRQKFSNFTFSQKEKLREEARKHLNYADAWLADCDGGMGNIEGRIQLLFFTTQILSRAETMTQKGILQVPDRTEPTLETSEPPQPPMTVRDIHSKTIQALHNLVDGFELELEGLKAALKIKVANHGRTRAYSQWHSGRFGALRCHLRNKFFGGPPTQTDLEITPEDHEYLEHFRRKLEESKIQVERLVGPSYNVPTNFFNTHQMLSRLAKIVGCHSESSNEDRENEELNQKIDDIIIYRSLLLGVLFYTALDNSELHKSGVWDRVVPII